VSTQKDARFKLSRSGGGPGLMCSHGYINKLTSNRGDTALVWTLPTPGPGGEMGTLILQGIFTPSF